MKLPRLFGREAKESATGAAIVMMPGQPAWSNRNYAAFADEGYRRNVVAYAAIERVAAALAMLKWSAWRGETELVAHPALDVLQNPNPAQSGGQYMRAKAGFFLLSGNGYEEYVRAGGAIREMYQLRPDRMKIVQDRTGFPMAYTYEAGGKTIRWPVEVKGGRMISDVRHLRTFNPLDDWYGMSPIEAAAYSIDQHNETSAWVKALLQNSARPSGALVVKDGALAPEQFDRLKAQMEDQYQGARNAGRPMLLEGGLDWKQMGLSPTDMETLETRAVAAREIALAFGVPPMLLGIPGDNTYANYREARLSFWEDTVMPLAETFADDWSEAFEVEIRPEADHIPAMAEKRSQIWDMAGKASFLTTNEKRELVGYDRIDGGDTIESAPEPQQPAPSAALLKALAYGDYGNA